MRKKQPTAVASNPKALDADLKPLSVSFADLIFENFESVDKQMPILAESLNNPLDFGAAESVFETQIAQPPSPSILDDLPAELVQVYGALT